MIFAEIMFIKIKIFLVIGKKVEVSLRLFDIFKTNRVFIFYYFTCLGFIGFGLDGDSEEINLTNNPTWRGPSSKASFYELILTALASLRQRAS